jgi:hypothetical protein
VERSLRHTDDERPPLLGPLVVGALAVIGALALLRFVVHALFGVIVLVVVVTLVVWLVRAALRR